MAALEDAVADGAKDLKLLHSLLGGLLSVVATAIVDAVDVSIELRSLHPLASLFFLVPMNSMSGNLCSALLLTTILKVYGGFMYLNMLMASQFCISLYRILSIPSGLYCISLICFRSL